MTEKRFELTMSGNEVAQYEIIDHSQEILTIYNDLGNVYFSSAMKICELLNSLADENEQLKEENEYLCEKIKENEWHWNTIDEDRDVWRYKCKTLEDENEQLKYFIQELTTKGTAKIHLANGSIYKVNAILNDFKSDDLND